MAKKQDSPSQDASAQQKNPQPVEAADERNALIAAWDEVNPGNRKTWKATRHEVETIWGKDAIRDGKIRPGYEYRGLPIELEE
jgi:hypothetical protein